MGLGINAGKALLRAENALSAIQAIRRDDDFRVKADLRAARCELNHLAREISRILRELDNPHV